MIFPVPVTLKRFFALEFVFTLGILNAFNYYTFEANLNSQIPFRASSLLFTRLDHDLKNYPLVRGGKDRFVPLISQT